MEKKSKNRKFIIISACCFILIILVLYFSLTGSKRTYSIGGIVIDDYNCDNNPTTETVDTCDGVTTGLTGSTYTKCAVSGGNYVKKTYTGCAVKANCNSNQWYNQSTNNCDTKPSCVAGQYYSSYDNTCKVCIKGFYSTTANATSCSQCEEGYTTPDVTGNIGAISASECHACNVAHATAYTGVICKVRRCEEGWTPSTDQTECVSTSSENNCEAGTFYVAATGACTPCLKGYYSSAKATSCTVCQGGYTTSGTSSTSSSACNQSCSNSANVKSWNTSAGPCVINECNTGYQKKTKSIGTYTVGEPTTYCEKITSTNTEENNCVAGQYYDGSTCVACAQGYYSDTAKATSCTQCGVGTTTSGPGSKSSSECSESAKIKSINMVILGTSSVGNSNPISTNDNYYVKANVNIDGNDRVKTYEWYVNGKLWLNENDKAVNNSIFVHKAGTTSTENVKVVVTLENSGATSENTVPVTINTSECKLQIFGSSKGEVFDSNKNNTIMLQYSSQGNCPGTSKIKSYTWSIVDSDNTCASIVKNANTSSISIKGLKQCTTTVKLIVSYNDGTEAKEAVKSVTFTNHIYNKCEVGKTGCFRCDQSFCIDRQHDCVETGGTFYLTADEEGYCECPSGHKLSDNGTMCSGSSGKATFYDEFGTVHSVLYCKFDKGTCNVTYPSYTCNSGTFKGWVESATACTSSASGANPSDKLLLSTSSMTASRYACCYGSNSGGGNGNGGNGNGGNNNNNNNNPSGNPNTGPALIVIVWTIGILMIGYAIWYFKNTVKE